MSNQSYDIPTIVRDTREKPNHGFRFIASKNCAGMVEEKLDFGDYAIKDHENLVIIERKQNVIELCGNLGKYRDRFEAELQRMLDAGVKRKYIIVEDYWSSVLRQQKFSRMKPNAIFESIIALQIKYDIPFIFAGTHDVAHRMTRSLLLKAYKYHCEGVL